MKIKITIPKGLQDFEPAHRLELMQKLEALRKLPKIIERRDMDESSMWAPNDDPLLALLENAMYEELVVTDERNIADLISYLGLPDTTPVRDELQKALPDIQDLIKISREKRSKFINYIQQTGSWTKRQLRRIDSILSQKLPDYAKVAEAFMTRAMLLSKVPPEVRELLSTTGALLDRLPSTIEAATRQETVLTLKEKARREAMGDKVTILPLTSAEAGAVKAAKARAGDKLTEVSQRIRDRVKELTIKAVEERWEPQELRSKLFDELGHVNHDWRRIALTELAMAYNDGYLLSVPEKSTVWVAPIPGSCKYCKNLLEGKTFIVIHHAPTTLTYEMEMKYVWPGKSNFGRRVAAWIPCVPLHPLCRHRYVQMSTTFYKLGDDGKPKLKTAKEMIQEERARRGLPPDPALY